MRPSSTWACGTPPAYGAQAGLHLGDHARGQRRAASPPARRGEPVDDGRLGAVGGRPVGVEPVDVGEDDQLRGVERDRERAGGRVGVDVVDLAVVAARDAGDHRDAAVVEEAAHGAGVDLDDLADLADVDRHAVDDGGLALGGEEPGVLPRHADPERAVLVEHADDVAADLADQHHADDVHGLGGGDAQARLEGALDAEPVELGVDLRAAAVDDDGAQPGVAQEGDVLGEGRRAAPRRSWRCRRT